MKNLYIISRWSTKWKNKLEFTILTSVNILALYGSKLSYRLFILVLVRNLAHSHMCCDFHLAIWSFIVSWLQNVFVRISEPMGKEPYVINSSHHTQEVCLCECLWHNVLLFTKYKPDYAALHIGNLANSTGVGRGGKIDHGY